MALQRRKHERTSLGSVARSRNLLDMLEDGGQQEVGHTECDQESNNSSGLVYSHARKKNTGISISSWHKT